MSDLSIRITADDPSLVPSYTRVGDAGLDLRSAIACTIAPGERMLIPTGIRIEIPAGFAGLVIPRSGLALKHGISIVNAPGLIDSNYRGEIGVILINTDAHESFTIEQGDRIAQLVITAVPEVSLEVVDSLEETVRGEAGFGSSGVAN